MSRLNKFPKYESHQEVICFKCDTLVDDYPRRSGFAPGRGEFKQLCSECCLFTYYDLNREAK